MHPGRFWVHVFVHWGRFWVHVFSILIVRDPSISVGMTLLMLTIWCSFGRGSGCAFARQKNRPLVFFPLSSNLSGVSVQASKKEAVSCPLYQTSDESQITNGIVMIERIVESTTVSTA